MEVEEKIWMSNWATLEMFAQELSSNVNEKMKSWWLMLYMG